jgi:Family of unknown function (DUF6069)
MKTSDHRIRHLIALGAAGAVAATVVNSAIYAVGRAADVAYLVKVTSHGPQNVRLQDVVSLSLMSFVLGIIAAAVATKLRRPSLRTMQVVGAVLAVVSTWGDFTIEGKVAAKATLALMHFVVGAAYIFVLQLVQSRRTVSVSDTPVALTAQPVGV